MLNNWRKYHKWVRGKSNNQGLHWHVVIVIYNNNNNRINWVDRIVLIRIRMWIWIIRMLLLILVGVVINRIIIQIVMVVMGIFLIIIRMAKWFHCLNGPNCHHFRRLRWKCLSLIKLDSRFNK